MMINTRIKGILGVMETVTFSTIWYASHQANIFESKEMQYRWHSWALLRILKNLTSFHSVLNPVIELLNDETGPMHSCGGKHLTICTMRYPMTMI